MELAAKNKSTVVVQDSSTDDQLRIFSIENKKGTRLEVSNLGAALRSLYVKNRNGELIDVALGYEKEEDYLNDEYYLGTVVGRFAGRIAGDSVELGGQFYKLSARDGGFHQHGGVQGFNKKFYSTHPFHTENSNGIIFRYTSPNLEEGFPGELNLEIIYTVDDEDSWTIEYRAKSDKTTLINLTHHGYFNLSGNPANNVDDHELKINADYFLPLNQQQIPTGEFLPVKDTVFDFTSFKTIGKDLAEKHPQLLLGGGYDHSFVLEKNLTSSLKSAATVKNHLSGIAMEVFTTEPSIHFYTGNFLQNLPGKKGIIYNKRAGLCLETQHFPDAPNQPHFPSTVLKAGEEFYSKTIFKFYV